jgi:hypothetical protein
MLKHKVCINVSGKDGRKTPVLRSGQKTIRNRLLDFILGGKIGVFVLTPGRSVDVVEIRELPEGGATDDAGQS